MKVEFLHSYKEMQDILYQYKKSHIHFTMTFDSIKRVTINAASMMV